MKLDELMPALRVGRRARRPGWRNGSHIVVGLIAGVRSDYFTKKDGAVESTWPSSQMESHDLLAEDWSLLPEIAYEGHVPRNYSEAFDVVISAMKKMDFDPYKHSSESRRFNAHGNAVIQSDCDWRTLSRDAVSAFMDVMQSTTEEAQRDALSKACCVAFQSLAAHIAEEYVRDVMRR